MSVNYAFAHMALRGLAFERPLDALGLIAMPVGREECARVWNRLAEKTEGGVRAEPEDFEGQVRTLPEGGDLGILALPQAKEMTEALLVGVYVSEGPKMRYFTLEVTQGLGDGAPSTVVCEWTRQGGEVTHANYGLTADPPGPDGFAAAVGRILRGEL